MALQKLDDTYAEYVNTWCFCQENCLNEGDDDSGF